jgi:hypothetical protein
MNGDELRMGASMFDEDALLCDKRVPKILAEFRDLRFDGSVMKSDAGSRICEGGTVNE